MDIDVKNALDQVRMICSRIEQKEHHDIWQILAQDVNVFIQRISVKNGQARFEYFSKIYFGANANGGVSGNFNQSSIPESLKIFYASGQKIAKVLIAFFTVLGKYYLSSAFDKKDISLEKLSEVLKQMSAFISEKESSQPKPAVKEFVQPLKTNKEMECGSKETAGKESEENTGEEPEETLEELLDKLNTLIGLDGVKKEVNQIIKLIKVQKKGEEFGAKLSPLSLHLVFYGNPGTGKTTVARLLGKIYRHLGVLSTGQMVEVDRGGLVAGFVGQTAIKTQEVIDKAMGGILFIDEAYALIHGKGETDFGQEAVDTILKAMEDHRDDFIVIVAGYPDLMKEFIASNPGLKSRFNQFINFEDYTPSELQQIFRLQCCTQGLKIEDHCEAFLQSYFEQLFNNRTEDYANGRDVRNYFEKVVKFRANRLAENLENITYEEYRTITLSDLEAAAENESVFV